LDLAIEGRISLGNGHSGGDAGVHISAKDMEEMEAAGSSLDSAIRKAHTVRNFPCVVHRGRQVDSQLSLRGLGSASAGMDVSIMVVSTFLYACGSFCTSGVPAESILDKRRGYDSGYEIPGE
jgi:hypothetical protein